MRLATAMLWRLRLSAWRVLPLGMRRRWWGQCVGGPLCGEWLPTAHIGYYALHRDNGSAYVMVPPRGEWSMVMDRYVRVGSRFHFKESVYMTRSRLEVEP